MLNNATVFGNDYMAFSADCGGDCGDDCGDGGGNFLYASFLDPSCTKIVFDQHNQSSFLLLLILGWLSLYSGKHGAAVYFVVL